MFILKLDDQTIHQMVNLYISKSSKTFKSTEDFYKFYLKCYINIKFLYEKTLNKDNFVVQN